MNDPHQEQDGPARAEVLQTVRVVQHYLPESSLSARESLDVRRDLTFLVIEAHRQVFRRPVVVAVCAAVVAYVAEALPEQVRSTMLRSCAAHLGWALAGDAAFAGPPESPLSFLRAAADGSSPVGGAAATGLGQAAPPLAPSRPPRPRSERDEGPT